MTDNRTTELLPCPFCGGKAELCVHDATGVSWVRCVECEAGGGATSSKMAIENWNRRAERECEPKWTMQGYTQTQEFWCCECGNCGECVGVEDRSTFPFKITIDEVDVPNYCPKCGKKVSR